jgi:hypothetical protein
MQKKLEVEETNQWHKKNKSWLEHSFGKEDFGPLASCITMY